MAVYDGPCVVLIATQKAFQPPKLPLLKRLDPTPGGTSEDKTPLTPPRGGCDGEPWRRMADFYSDSEGTVRPDERLLDPQGVDPSFHERRS